MKANDFLQYVARKRREHGDKFTTAALPAKFIPFYESGQRIEVTRTYANGEKYTRRGTVGITTGWQPAFLLMRTTRSMGSSDLLDAQDNVVKVIPTRKRR